MKTKIFLWAVLLFSGLISKLNAQDFYPTNLTAIIYTDEKNVIKINDDYINHKGFLWLNDSTYAKKDLSGVIQVTAKNSDKSLEVQVNYYLTNNNLDRFVKRAANSALDKTGVDKFEKTYKGIYYKIEIKRAVSFQNKTYNLISFTQRNESDSANLDKNQEPRKRFEYVESYPFQNTVWYLDTKKTEVKNKNEDIIKYVISLTENKTTDVKLEFLDDFNMKLTYGPPQKRQYLLGTYHFYRNSIGHGLYENKVQFEMAPAVQKTTKPGYKVPELVGMVETAPKNTTNYFRYWLSSFDYEVKWGTGSSFTLTREVDNNTPVYAVPTPKN